MNITYKIILLGDSGVGKSSFLNKLVNTDMIPIGPTIGVDFQTIKTEIKGEFPIDIHIWDTAGQENFHSIVRSYYRCAIGAIIFFDLSSKKSLDHCDYWISDLLRTKSCIILLVGHKSDLPESEKIDSTVVASTIDILKAKYAIDILYCEVSSLNNTGVRAALDLIVDDIHRQWPVMGQTTMTYPVGVRIDRKSNNKSCCIIQ